MKVSIRKIVVTPEKERWLRNFVQENHSTPKHLLNSVEDDWDRRRLHVYEILEVNSFLNDERVVPIGITSFQQITNHLGVKQKTIVAKEFRRQGVGSQVHDMIEEEMRRFGIGKCISHVFDFNLPMIALLLKKGYRAEALLRDHHAPGYNEYIMSKLL